MSSSSSTTPARAARSASIRRTVFTWVLLGIWAALISFAIVCMSGPAWLEGWALKGTKGEATAYKHYGDTEFRQGRYVGAITQYVRALEIRNDEPGIWLNLGIAYLRTNQPPQAERALQTVLTVNPTDQMKQYANFYLAEANEKQGRRPAAVKFYEQALAEGARPEAVFRRLGSLYLAQEELGRADEYFRRALEGQLDALNPYREMLLRAREDFGNNPQHLSWIQAEEARKPAEADLAGTYDMTVLRQMLEMDPEIAKTQNHLGYIAYRLGKEQEAVEHFRRSLQIWPGNPDARNNLQILEESI